MLHFQAVGPKLFFTHSTPDAMPIAQIPQTVLLEEKMRSVVIISYKAESSDNDHHVVSGCWMFLSHHVRTASREAQRPGEVYVKI